MKARLSKQLGCAEKEKMLPEHHHRGNGLCLVTCDGGTHYPHSLPPILFPAGAASSSCAPRDTLVLEAQRELAVMVPICLSAPKLHYCGDAAGIPLVTAGFWDGKSGPASQSQGLFAP